MRILVTGAAGFIGFHVCKRLASKGIDVVGLDNLSEYYDASLKDLRLRELGIDAAEFRTNKYASSKKLSLEMYYADLADKTALNSIFSEYEFDVVVNLAAQAGVRYARSNPDVYVSSNLTGFCNILELSKESSCSHFIYASSSSVYGAEKQLPYHESQEVNTPLNLYAASKKANEMLAYSYSHLFKMKTTGLRFFTVYGPFGRPDMAYFKFTKSILAKESIDVYGAGKVFRDFTYIDDIVDGICAVVDDEEDRGADVLNIGCGSPDTVMKLVESLESALKKKADIRWKDLPADDMPHTYCCVNKFQEKYGFKATIGLDEGISRFVDWYTSINVEHDTNKPLTTKNIKDLVV